MTVRPICFDFHLLRKSGQPSLRVAFIRFVIIIVILLAAAFVFLFVVFLFWFLSKEGSMGSYQPIRRVRVAAF
jgi:hypothetical protein